MCHFWDTFFFIIYIGYTGKRILKGVFCFMMNNKVKKEMAENEYFRLEVELLKDSIIKRFMTGGD